MSNKLNLLKSNSKKGFVNGLKILLHQNYFNDNYVENLLDNYNVLKSQFRGKQEALIIPHGILYGIYFYQMRQNYFNGAKGLIIDNINAINPLNVSYWLLGKAFEINNQKSSTKKKNDLRELAIYQKSMQQELKAQIPPKDAFNMYMISSCLMYLLNPADKRKYTKDNIIFLHLATIIELVSLKTIKEYTNTKSFYELIGINERVKRYIIKNCDFFGEIPNVFTYTVPAESEYFPENPWMDEYFFTMIRRYRSRQ